ncbi:MAG: type I asparaginase [Bacteroidales bacterium]|nr:type I asparaginase [Bacteroidales bacterium]
MNKPKIHIIYTGGTIGMIQDKNGVLQPFNFENLLSYIPMLKDVPADISSYSFKVPIDSSDANPEFWKSLVEVIEESYDKYDGFVVLHGSDTMAYTASALSFMLENVNKPIILTGSQLPIGLLRTDGRENMISAIELASMQRNGKPLIHEVCVYFGNSLYRGNRTTKFSAENFDAFRSPNYPILAHAGIEVKVFEDKLWTSENKPLVAHKNLCSDIAVLKYFPGISEKTVETIAGIDGLRGLIIESYGSGNLTTNDNIINILRRAVNRGVTILNVTQCIDGSVVHGKYATSLKLEECGVISGKDMTIEAAISKMMFLLGMNYSPEKMKELLPVSMRGEVS